MPRCVSLSEREFSQAGSLLVTRAFVAILLAATLTISTSAVAQAACDPAAGLTFICGLTNAEDLVAVPGAPWIIASGTTEGAGKDGHIYLVNTADRSAQVLLPGHVAYRQDRATFPDCPGPPDEARFVAHGLGLRVGVGGGVGAAGENTLYVVHHGERESVEVFTVSSDGAAPTLAWVGCVLYPAGAFGNGVAPLPDGAFTATNFFSTDDPASFDKLMAGQPEGGLLIWRPKTGWERVPEAAGISGDNGVAASADGKQIFVAGTGDETVVRLSLVEMSQVQTGGSPRWERAIIKTGFHTDNLRWGSDGFLYASGARDSMANLFACAPNKPQRCTTPFSVLKIDPVTLQSWEVLHHPGSPHFGAASTALRIGNEFWLSTPHGDRIAIAPAN